MSTTKEILQGLCDTDQTLLEACKLLGKTDTLISIRLDQTNERIDIVNKRIRRLEEAVARLTPR